MITIIYTSIAAIIINTTHPVIIPSSRDGPKFTNAVVLVIGNRERSLEGSVGSCVAKPIIDRRPEWYPQKQTEPNIRSPC